MNRRLAIFITFLIVPVRAYCADLVISKQLVPVGGIDFSMMGTFKPPVFQSRGDAIQFANRVKWNDYILIVMTDHLRELGYDAYDYHSGWMRPGQKREGNWFYEQWLYTDLAVRILQNWKSKKIPGDPAMGSSVFIGSVPL